MVAVFVGGLHAFPRPYTQNLPKFPKLSHLVAPPGGLRYVIPAVACGRSPGLYQQQYCSDAADHGDKFQQRNFFFEEYHAEDECQQKTHLGDG